MRSRCTKGKSCGATCIERSKWCELELGPRLSKSLAQARERIGVLGLFAKVREHGVKGHKAKFDAIRKELKGELGHQIRKTEHIKELKQRLQKGGLLPKTQPSREEGLGDIFNKAVQAGKGKEKPQSLPSDLKNQLWQLPGAEGKAKTTSSERRKKVADDISRILRGESPLNLEVATAPGKEGFKVRDKQTTSGSGSATGNTRWARLDAKDHDDGLYNVRREGDAKYDGWKDSYGSGAKKIGEGAYGTVMRNPDGTFVKRGDIADTEAALIKRLGERDLGPRLIAADINGPARYHQENFVDVKNGRIAMGEVPGKPIGAAAPNKQFGGKNAADIYWKAMADLHRMGIAHNDAHIDNILVDDKGKGRWVDLGLAQASPKAALAEAMGIFPTLRGAPADRVQGAYGQGNWQTRRWDATGFRLLDRYLSFRDRGESPEMVAKARDALEKEAPALARIANNRAAAQFKLRDMGLTKTDISTIIDHGIRSTPESYTKGPWAKLTDAQAQEILNILYDGI